jgi:HEAT repeat protein
MASLKEWVAHRKTRGLLAQLSSPDPQTRNAAVRGLVSVGRHALPDLLDALKSPDARVRAGAAHVLSEVRAAGAMEPLAARLADPDNEVVLAVRSSLARFGQSAVPVLLRCLESPRPDVRRNAAGVLGEVGDASAIPWLIRLLGADDDINVRQAAAEALGAIRDPRAVAPLVKLLHGGNPSVASRALTALHSIGTPEALSALSTYRERRNLHVLGLQT